MNKEELAGNLKAQGVREGAYSIGETFPERYVIIEKEGRWLVFYSERNLKTGLRDFTTESDACDYMLRLVLDDPTTREGGSR